MVDTLRDLLQSSLSASSRKLYSRAWVVFSDFYQRFQYGNVTLPVSTAGIAMFVSFLCAKGLAPATITSYLSAISYVHKIKGVFDPTKAFLIEKLMVAVGRRSQADIRLPISRPLLYELIRALAYTNSSAYQRSLYSAMFAIAFYGFFRVGELTCKTRNVSSTVLQLNQLTLTKLDHHVTAVKIVISKFKHNTSNRPFTVLIEHEPSEPFCPIRLLTEFLQKRGVRQGPLFAFADMDAVLTSQFNAELRRALIFCGLDISRYKKQALI